MIGLRVPATPWSRQRGRQCGAVLFSVAGLLGCTRGSAGCSAQSAEEQSAEEQSAEERTVVRGGSATSSSTQASGEEPSLDRPTPFDFRWLIINPEEHLDETKICAVHQTGLPTAIEESKRDFYPESATFRVPIECRAARGSSAVDLALRSSQRESAALSPRRWVSVRTHAAAGGEGDRPVVEFLGNIADRDGIDTWAPFTPFAPPGDPLAEPLAGVTAPAFDFASLTSSRARASAEPVLCGVLFAGPLRIVQENEHRRHDYPEDITHRLDVKCLRPNAAEASDLGSTSGAWVDLVFGRDEAERVFWIAEGGTLSLRVLRPDDAFAGRPLVRLAPEDSSRR